MRIWSLHPSYLDSKGLVALWREGLLAYHVLSGKTKAYVNHPQLIRFRSHEAPLDAISFYLHIIADEADRRGYKFSRHKLPPIKKIAKIPVTNKQILFEAQHLKKKLEQRDTRQFNILKSYETYEVHPLFRLIEGETEPWERV